MDRSLAERIDRLTRDASNVVDQSIVAVRAGTTSRAAGVYTSSIGKIMGEMAVGLLFPIWREHPGLEHESSEGPSTYNAREFEMSGEASGVALAALQRAREMMAEVGRQLEQEPNAEEREAYMQQLRGVLEAIDAANRSVELRRSGR